MKKLLMILLILTLPTLALANDSQVPLDAGNESVFAESTNGLVDVDGVNDLPEAGKSIFDAFKGGQLRTAIAGIIVLLMFVWRKFLGKFIVGRLSGWWLGFLNAFLALLATVPEALVMEPFKWSTFLWATFLTSAQAMFMWQMLLKKLPFFKVDKPE